ncbi:hypothetical protein J5834_02485 [bacterium]|nr:hypothetical protein [bacterium]
MHIHFMGIGGSGVSGLSIFAASLGYKVSGCDPFESDYLKMVKERGIPCMKGHSADHLDGVDLLVRSSAVHLDNEEVVEAKRRGIEVKTRGEFLAFLLRDRHVIGVGGSHGKTTTTWMIFRLLREAGVKASIYAGGKSGGSSNLCDSEPFVVELDESDGSIFLVKPASFVLTNLEYEHADYYKSPLDMLKRFENYLLSFKQESLVVGRGFDLSDKIYNDFSPLSFPSRDELERACSFQNSDGSGFCVYDGKLWFEPSGKKICVGRLSEPLHILQNRSAALLAANNYLGSVGKSLPDIDYEPFWASLPNVDRRFQVVGSYHGLSLVDDYAHHPSEIRATIEQAEKVYHSFYLIFQPHRYSRFSAFYDKFVDTLKGVENLFVLPVYAAGEDRTDVDSESFVKELNNSGSNAKYFESVDQLVDFIKKNIGSFKASAIVSVGAGDLNRVLKELSGAR